MPEQLFANTASTTITETITAGQTTLPVASSASFPSAIAAQDKEFRAAFMDDATSPPTVREYITVRNVDSSTSWTVVREAEDSSRFPAGAWASGTRIAHVATAGVLRNLLPKARNVFHDIRDYGAVGSNDTANAGAVECAQPLMDAAEAANESLEETYKTDANGTGRVYIPGNRDYKVSSTVAWPINVTMMGGTGTGAGHANPPRFRWHGAVDGIMFETTSTGVNIPGVSVENVMFDGRNGPAAQDAGQGLGAGTAFRFGPDPSTPTAGAKPDTGCQFVDTHIQKLNLNALQFDSNGLTNWVWERGRFDQIGGYCIYIRVNGSAFLNVHDMTWDSGGTNDTAAGFIFFDGEAQTENNKSFCRIANVHLEVNQSLKQTYVPTGWSPTGADTRGLIRFGVSVDMPGVVQHMFSFENVWVPLETGNAPLSFFQITSTPLTVDNRTRHARAVKITGDALHGLSGLAADNENSNTVLKLIGGVNAADTYPFTAGHAQGTKQLAQFSYVPRTDVPQGEGTLSWFKGRTLIDGLNLPQSATVGAAGGGASLPATPVKYLVVYDDAGNQYKIPAYNP